MWVFQRQFDSQTTEISLYEFPITKKVPMLTPKTQTKISHQTCCTRQNVSSTQWEDSPINAKEWYTPTGLNYFLMGNLDELNVVIWEGIWASEA